MDNKQKWVNLVNDISRTVYYPILTNLFYSKTDALRKFVRMQNLNQHHFTFLLVYLLLMVLEADDNNILYKFSSRTTNTILPRVLLETENKRYYFFICVSRRKNITKCINKLQIFVLYRHIKSKMHCGFAHYL